MIYLGIFLRRYMQQLAEASATTRTRSRGRAPSPPRLSPPPSSSRPISTPPRLHATACRPCRESLLRSANLLFLLRGVTPPPPIPIAVPLGRQAAAAPALVQRRRIWRRRRLQRRQRPPRGASSTSSWPAGLPAPPRTCSSRSRCSWSSSHRHHGLRARRHGLPPQLRPQ